MSKLAISNIAWPETKDSFFLDQICKLGLSDIEVSPFRLSSDKNFKAVFKLNDIAGAKNINIVALQALMYRHPELQLFKDSGARQKLNHHLISLIDLAVSLNAKVLVFGAPKNKVLGRLNHHQALMVAVEFFQQISKYAEQKSITFCIEPTPSIYGAEFITNSEEALKLIELVNSRAFKLNFDIGSALSNHENIKQIIDSHIAQIGHVHISEPDLSPIMLDKSRHMSISNALKRNRYEGFASVEMLAPKNNPEATVIDVLTFLKDIY